MRTHIREQKNIYTCAHTNNDAHGGYQFNHPCTMHCSHLIWPLAEAGLGVNNQKSFSISLCCAER